MFTPTVFGNLTGINQMTATTMATVVSVGPASYSTSTNGSRSSSPTCSLTAHYSVNGQEYSNPSFMSSSDNCSLVSGQEINVNYNPNNPGSWAYGTKSIGTFMNIFFWIGLFALVSSILTFLIRLFSIIFGWKLLRDGRKNAANLPPGTNLQTMIDEIKQNFTASVFGFGGSQKAPPQV